MRHERTIKLKPVGPDDLGVVDAVFDDLTGYSMNIDGVPRRADAASAFMNAVPPGFALRDKHAFFAKAGGETVGLLDVIDGYPAPGTGFIGLLAIRESAQGKGYGRALAQAAEQMAREKLKAHKLRLAVVESNPVLGFWTSMGFQATGEVKPYQGQRKSSSVVLMEKHLKNQAHPV